MRLSPLIISEQDPLLSIQVNIKMGKNTMNWCNKLSGREFEESTAELLRAMDYVDVKRVGKTADRGVDVIGYHMDQLGYRSKIIVQCKFYDKNPVSSGELQVFVGALATHEAERGIFVTSSFFTREAKEIARLNSITLIDGERFAELSQTYGIKTIKLKEKTRKLQIDKSSTPQNLYDNLSFGSSKGKRHDLVIPTITSEAFIEGFVYSLVHGSGMNLEDVEISNAVIEVKGFFVINWYVNKVWHDSQGRVRDRWSGTGLYVTDERGKTVIDKGSSRRGIEESRLAEYGNLEPTQKYHDIVSKFNIRFPKIKRVAFKRLIKINRIPSNDIHCDTKKVYVASSIRIEYRYKRKKCSFSLDLLTNKLKHKRPVFTKQDIEQIAVQEHPELETVDIKIQEGKDRWTVSAETPLKISFSIYKFSGNILTDKTPEEKILEEALEKAKKIFPDAKHIGEIALIIIIKEVCSASWVLEFTSRNGHILVKSSVDGKMTLTKKINEKYALELAMKQNEYGSDFDKMKKDAEGYNFSFKDPRYEWILLVDFEGETTMKSFKLTYEEAVNQAIQRLIDDNITSPSVVSKPLDYAQVEYKIKLQSEEDGGYVVNVFHNVFEKSCEIVERKITEHRANYLAQKTSKGEVFSVKKRFFGLRDGWNAVITGDKGNKRKILIKSNGEIIEQ